MWKGGRVAEGARLESVLWVTPYEGSNPSLSAIKKPAQKVGFFMVEKLVRLEFSVRQSL